MLRNVTLVIALLFAAGSGVAHACQSHSQISKIDAALAKNPAQSSVQIQEARKYRTEGEAQLKAGKHKESMESLAKAEKLLGLK